MDERLFAHVNIAADNIGFLDGRAHDLGVECARYDRAIAAAGGLDILVLGIGVNGHIGFNEPAEALTAASHTATLDEPTRAANALWFDGDLRQVPREALTMGMAAILSARTVILMATGEGKAEAVRAMIEGGVTPRVPASFLQLHPRTVVMLDEPAAGELDYWPMSSRSRGSMSSPIASRKQILGFAQAGPGLWRATARSSASQSRP